MVEHDILRAARDAGIHMMGASTILGHLDFEVPVMVYPECYLWNVRFGAYSYVTEKNFLRRVRVGRFCSIGRECLINPPNHPTDRLTTASLTYQADFGWFRPYAIQEPFDGGLEEVIIGHDVWIGARATITPGVKIGHGAIIGTGAVVTRDVAPYAIMGGVPARTIRQRFPDDIAERLLRLNWWDYDLAGWAVSGAMPSTSNLDHRTLDLVEEAIASGALARLATPMRRLKRAAGGQWHLSPLHGA